MKSQWKSIDDIIKQKQETAKQEEVTAAYMERLAEEKANDKKDN